jgi:HEPN domain-containing protein
MPTRNQLKKLSILRLKEAEALFDAGFYDGAAYLCGYSVELALKARICKLLNINEYPEGGKLNQAYKIHDFEQLLLLSGLKSDMTASSATFVNWQIATPWKPDRRYEAKGTYSRNDAREIIEAVRVKPDGVLRWIMKYW